MSLATISIVGNLVRDPEQFQFDSGRVKTTLIVAVNTFNRARQERCADFYKIETWDKLAELARSYLEKGNQVAVTGRLVMEKWVDREGKDRMTPTIHANQLALPQRGQNNMARESEFVQVPKEADESVETTKSGSGSRKR